MIGANDELIQGRQSSIQGTLFPEQGYDNESLFSIRNTGKPDSTDLWNPTSMLGTPTWGRTKKHRPDSGLLNAFDFLLISYKVSKKLF